MEFMKRDKTNSRGSGFQTEIQQRGDTKQVKGNSLLWNLSNLCQNLLWLSPPHSTRVRQSIFWTGYSWTINPKHPTNAILHKLRHSSNPIFTILSRMRQPRLWFTKRRRWRIRDRNSPRSRLRCRWTYRSDDDGSGACTQRGWIKNENSRTIFSQLQTSPIRQHRRHDILGKNLEPTQ